MSIPVEDILLINDLTSQFYKLTCESFSRTRSNPWDGWNRVVQVITKEFSSKNLTFLDIGCGNIRFEKFISKSIPESTFNAFCLDNCPELSQDITNLSNMNIHFKVSDVVKNLIDGSRLSEDTNNDFCVSFGVLHHIPGIDLQKSFIQQCLNSVRIGGIVIISFWQFQKDDRILNKAQKSRDTACNKFNLKWLNTNDYFLQWQDRNDVFRFCHAFTDDEIIGLCSSSESQIIETFYEDGKNHNLNKYVIMKRTN